MFDSTKSFSWPSRKGHSLWPFSFVCYDGQWDRNSVKVSLMCCWWQLKILPQDTLDSWAWWHTPLSWRQRQVDRCELEASLVYNVNTRTARTTRRNPASEKEGKYLAVKSVTFFDWLVLTSVTWDCAISFPGTYHKRCNAVHEKLGNVQVLYKIITSK